MIISFVKIIVKILVPHLQDQVKFFLKNIELKRPKTIYDNKKLALEIQFYIVKYIQNLDQILADLERAKVIIFVAKSQFCGVGLKIVKYIYDIAGHYLNILKIIKILYWLKCIDTTFI